MKCIYCNSETELTSSDIITYAITGAKLTKSFVCKTHNALTNDKYEKKFVADLDFFRNHLGLTTRGRKPIQYIADISVDGIEMHNVKISNRNSLYAPKGVVTGVDDEKKKILMAPMEKLENISKGKASTVDISDVTLYKKISSDSFLGFYAVHSIAKMAYEWYCYINGIEEFAEEYNEIVEYILGNKDGNFVDIIIEENYYAAMDKLSEIGTNTFFQYDDIDGYRYVVFDFWKTISYRVRICESPKDIACDMRTLYFNLYLYHIDGSKSTKVFSVYSLDSSKNSTFYVIQPQNITTNIWKVFLKRTEKIISTMILSINILRKEVDILTSKLKKYDEEKINVAQLLEFGENNIVTTVEIINQLYFHKDKYDITKSFNQNLPIILNLDSDTIERTQEEKEKYIEFLVMIDKEKKLSEYIWNGIYAFNEIYENEMNLIK
ncbi:MAG: hypothetical protein ACLUVC_04690 [Longibaculum sp.]